MTVILTILLFFLPFLVFPVGRSQFEIPKVIAAEIGIEIILFLFLLKNSFSVFFNKKYLPFFGMFLLSSIHLIFLQTEISFFGNSFRLQGIFLLWHLLLLSLLSSKVSFLKIPFWLPLLLLFFQLFTTLFFGTTITGRSIGTLGEPNALAAIAVFLFPFAFFLSQKQKKRWSLICIAFIITLSIIYLSGSRSGMLALCLQTIFLVLIFIKKITFQYSVFIACCLFLFSLLTPFFTTQNEYENRVEVWEIAFKGGFEHPLLGGGFGNLEKIFHTSAERIDLPIQYYYVDSSHNIFLDFWFQGGIIGLSLFLFLLAQTIRNFVLHTNALGITLLLGLLTVLSFNPASVIILIAFWWLIGNSFYAATSRKNGSA